MLYRRMGILKLHEKNTTSGFIRLSFDPDPRTFSAFTGMKSNFKHTESQSSDLN